MRLRETDRRSADDRGTDGRIESEGSTSARLDKEGVTAELRLSKEALPRKVDEVQSQATHTPVLRDEIHEIMAKAGSTIRDSTCIKSIYTNNDYRMDYSAMKRDGLSAEYVRNVH